MSLVSPVRARPLPGSIHTHTVANSLPETIIMLLSQATPTDPAQDSPSQNLGPRGQWFSKLAVVKNHLGTEKERNPDAQAAP